MTKIHFICRGNTHRSRLAEAYAKFLCKNVPEVDISSSGIEASLNLNGNVINEVIKQLAKDGILGYLKPTWDQTTQSMVDNSDLIVVMSDDVLEDAKKFLKFPKDRLVLLNIPDIEGAYEKIKPEVERIIKKYLDV